VLPADNDSTSTTVPTDATAAAKAAVDYINANLAAGGGVVFSSVEDEGGIYMVTTTYQGSEIYFYMTADGKWIFGGGVGTIPIDLSAPTTTTTTTTTNPTAACAGLPKTGTAELEAFVVSYCPYGLQMQRMLSEAVNNIPALADSITVRYIGAVEGGSITSMHGTEEATENLRQICIREEQGDKYWSYVSCFMKAGDDVAACLAEAAVDTAKLDSCMSDSSKGLAYAQEDFNLASTYGATGSPTLILNGAEVSEFPFGGRTAEAVKQIVCCSLITAPSGCSQTLTTQQAATSFSQTYSSGSGSTSGSSSC
jgi:hypothetical protein